MQSSTLLRNPSLEGHQVLRRVWLKLRDRPREGDAARTRVSDKISRYPVQNRVMTKFST